MSHEVYLGPYAECRLRPGEIKRVFHQNPFWGEDPFWQEIGDRLWLAWTRELPPAITVGGVKYHRYCFLPRQHPPKGPLREFRRNAMTGIVDLRGIDVQAELDWFAREFGPDLGRVGDRLGRPATLHWGVVAWEND